jgi:hypothetical protein
MATDDYPEAPQGWVDIKAWSRQVVERLNGIIRAGRVNCRGRLTLDPANNFTTVVRTGVLATSVVLLMPTAAASEVPYYVTCTLGSFTIHHAAGINGATFAYVFFA